MMNERINLEIAIKQLEKEMDIQAKANIVLYKKLPLDPMDKNYEPIVTEWRKGSKKLGELKTEWNKLKDELAKLKRDEENKKEKTFVNSYGEATKREITSTTYNNYQKRLDKQILSFIGR